MNAPDNLMTHGLGAALERHYAAANVQRVLDGLAALRDAERRRLLVIWPQVPMPRDRRAA